MTERFMLDDTGELIDLNTHSFIDYGDEVCNLLNELAEENQRLQYFESHYRNRNLKLEKENKELKKQREELFLCERDTKNELRELKERNNRQAKRLDNLYHLIEKQDWKTLKGLIQEFQECEEQLQREWGTYGDFE